MLNISREEAKLLYAVMGYVRVDNDVVYSLNNKLKDYIEVDDVEEGCLEGHLLYDLTDVSYSKSEGVVIELGELVEYAAGG